MQFLSLALNDAEAAGVEIVEVFRQNLKFREQLELEGFSATPPSLPRSVR
jgi:hypothetical protein